MPICTGYLVGTQQIFDKCAQKGKCSWIRVPWFPVLFSDSVSRSIHPSGAQTLRCGSVWCVVSDRSSFWAHSQLLSSQPSPSHPHTVEMDMIGRSSLFVMPADSRYTGRGLISCVPPTPQDRHPQRVSRPNPTGFTVSTVNKTAFLFCLHTPDSVRTNLCFQCWRPISAHYESSMGSFTHPNNYSRAKMELKGVESAASCLQNNWNLSVLL